MRRRVSFGVELTLFRRQLREVLEQAANASTGGFFPLVDVTTTNQEIVVRLDIPGADPHSLRVEVIGEELKISGEKRPPDPGRHYFQVERSYGPFLVEVALPGKVQGHSSRASYRGGVLEVRLAKQQEQPPESISITVHEGEP